MARQLGVGRIILTNAEKVERNYFDTHVIVESFYRPLLVEGLQRVGWAVEKPRASRSIRLADYGISFPSFGLIATEKAGQVTIAKLNVDEHGDIAQRYGIMSIPTLLVFKQGELVKRVVGAKGKGQLLQDLSEFIG